MHLSRRNYSPKRSEYSVDRQLVFLKNLLIFNRKIIALQYCVGFCHTLTWSSHQSPPSWHHMSPPSWLLTPAAEQMNSRRLFVKCRIKKGHRISEEQLITGKAELNSVKEMRVETLRERTRWMEMNRNSILGELRMAGPRREKQSRFVSMNARRNSQDSVKSQWPWFKSQFDHLVWIWVTLG